MDGTPLDRAYTAAKAADAAVLSGDFARAAAQYTEAADAFQEVATAHATNASARTLVALAEQHRGLANYFSSGRAAEEMKKRMLSPSGSMDSTLPSTMGPTTGSGASVGQMPNHNSALGKAAKAAAGSGFAHLPPANHHSTYISSTLQTSMRSPSASLTRGVGQLGFGSTSDDAVSALAARSAAVFSRTFDKAIAGKLSAPGGIGNGSGGMGHSSGMSGEISPGLSGDTNAIEFSNGPSESFYLVKPKAPKLSFAKQSLNALSQARAPRHSGSSRRGSSARADQASKHSYAESGTRDPRYPSSQQQQGGFTSGPGSNVGTSALGLSNLDRAHAIERATNAQKEELRSGLQQIVNDLNMKEEAIRDEQLNEIDQLRAENDRLKIQVSKLKSRWEDLKESARRRQTPADL